MPDKIIGTGITFDDVLLVPARSAFLPAETDVSTRLTKKIRLNIPIVADWPQALVESTRQTITTAKHCFNARSFMVIPPIRDRGNATGQRKYTSKRRMAPAGPDHERRGAPGFSRCGGRTPPCGGGLNSAKFSQFTGRPTEDAR